MGVCRIILLSCLIGLVSFIYFTFVKNSYVSLPKEVYDDHYWGKRVLKAGESLPKDDPTIRPFKVVYDAVFVKDLHERLDKTRYVQPLQSNFQDGFNGDYLKKVVQHWRNNYDWKKQVDYLNSYAQFKTQIEGIDLHFFHIKPLGTPKTVKQIVLVNGWPSNFYQMFKLADLLRKPVNDIAFEIIIPSRPGYGYSEQPHRTGFSAADVARIYVKLMKRLGHNKFFFHGEDWGAIEAHGIAALYPDNIEGIHFGMALADMNLKSTFKMAIGAYFPSLIYPDEFEAKQFESPLKMFTQTLGEMGYFLIQSTKPDTIGASLVDSPAGLAAYVLEKFSTWMNKSFKELPDGGLTKKLNLDELLTNIMIYWQTQTGAYSTRYYKEFSNFIFSGQDISKTYVDRHIPAGFSIGEHEIDVGKLRPKGKYRIVKFDYIKNTGHFSAFENPTEVNEHLRKFVSIVLDEQKEKPKSTEL